MRPIFFGIILGRYNAVALSTPRHIDFREWERKRGGRDTLKERQRGEETQGRRDKVSEWGRETQGRKNRGKKRLRGRETEGKRDRGKRDRGGGTEGRDRG